MPAGASAAPQEVQLQHELVTAELRVLPCWRSLHRTSCSRGLRCNTEDVDNMRLTVEA